ncbi:MAG: hypothetical protein J5730_03015 [Bacteroidales bacterium]|nr:hypothetical protein [Bacteroidales bacterium]
MHLFYLGVPARRHKTQIPPPRRRAFRCNGWQASHFHCNPSRMLVGHHIRFAANNVLPRLNILPRRDFSPRAIHPRGCGARSSHLNPWPPRYAALQGCSSLEKNLMTRPY